MVVPCYNERDVLPETIAALTDILSELEASGKISVSSFLFFVDDGSTDETWNIIKAAHAENARVKGLKLARNTGHQNALLAGLHSVRETIDCAITLDADLQDDTGLIEKMIDSHWKGSEIVYGVRRKRRSDTFFKRNTAMGFYRFMKLIGIDVVQNHSDFRLMGESSLQSLALYGESTLFLRGIVAGMGYPCAQLPYDRKKRLKGQSKYPLRKMLSLAWNAVCSFSVAPLRFISFIGALIFLLSAVMSGWVLFTKFFGDAVHGWASTLLPIYFLGGIQLLAIGVLGEYLGKIYMEVKKRPRYIIEQHLE